MDDFMRKTTYYGCKSRNEMGRFRIIILVRLSSFFSREKKLPLAFHGLPGRSKGKKQREKPPGS